MRTALVVVAGLGLVGCGGLYGHDEFANYTERKDTITMGAGDAQRANIVTQTMDGGMWPRGVSDRRIMVEGTKGVRAAECYREGSKKGSPGSVSNSTSNTTPSADGGSQTNSQTTTQRGNIGANDC